MLVEMADTGEFLQEIEGNVGLMSIDRATNGGEVIRDADREYVVPQRFDRIAHIIFCLSKLPLLLTKVLELTVGHQALVHEQDHPQLFLARSLPGHGEAMLLGCSARQWPHRAPPIGVLKVQRQRSSWGSD